MNARERAKATKAQYHKRRADNVKKLISEKAKEHFGSADILIEPLLARSLEKFLGGLRSKEPLMFQGRIWTEKDNYLLSTYTGGEFAVLTTATHQWFMLTRELEEADGIIASHRRNSTLFTTVVG